VSETTRRYGWFVVDRVEERGAVLYTAWERCSCHTHRIARGQKAYDAIIGAFGRDYPEVKDGQRDMGEITTY
jgi:hypothetical protein